MAYTGKEWKCGDVINASDLNRIERGIEAVGIETNIQNPTDGQTLKYDAASGKWVNGEGGSGSSLVANISVDNEAGTYTLDKTFQQIVDAYPNATIRLSLGDYYSYMTVLQIISNPSISGDKCRLYVRENAENEIYEYSTNETNGYPVASFGES